MIDEYQDKVGSIIIGCDELRDLIQSPGCCSRVFLQMKVLRSGIKNKIEEGKYFSVDKILKQTTIKKEETIVYSPYTNYTMVLRQG